MIKYNISDYITTMDIVKTSPDYGHTERNRFKEEKHDLKCTVYKWRYYEGYFDNCGLSEEDFKYIKKGYSPVRISENGSETVLFTIHHIKPLSCGGETRPSNLIPLPRSFHDFIHEKIIDRQINHLQIGDTTTIIGLPDFSKITLPMMMDSGFKIQYYKYLVDKFRMIPPVLINSHTNEIRKKAFAEWYKRNFGHLK